MDIFLIFSIIYDVFNLMKKVGRKWGKHIKIAITIMVGALSLVAFGCETEKDYKFKCHTRK